MNYQGANIFLAIVEHQNITAAAKALYITQPAISAHINRLEKELGVQLMIRKRGTSKIELTPEGEAFIPVAKEWVAAEHTLQNYKDAYQRFPLRIGATAKMHQYLTAPIVEKLQKVFHHLDVQIQTFSDSESDLLFRQPEFDVAFRFTYSQSHEDTQYCTQTPFFQDSVYILCPVDTPLPERILNPDDLDLSFELRNAYTPERVIWWRQKNFPEYTMSRFHPVIPGFNIYQHFSDPRCWAFYSATIAEYLISEYPGKLTCRQISPMPPARSGNIVVSKTFARPDILQVFYNCCQEYVAERPYLTSLLPETV